MPKSVSLTGKTQMVKGIHRQVIRRGCDLQKIFHKVNYIEKKDEETDEADDDEAFFILYLKTSGESWSQVM